MDRRDDLASPWSTSFHTQRGMTGFGLGSQPSVHGSPGIHPLSNPNVQFQSNIGGSSFGSTLPVDPSTAISPHGVNVSSPASIPQSKPVKKRGRPRKYRPEGSVSTHPGTISPTQKQGEWFSGSAGMGLTPHIIIVAVGEDVVTKLLSFSQQCQRDICVLSANGTVSAPTLRHTSTSGGTVKYEGHFEIMCLSGSYMLTDNGDPHNRYGGLSVSLASPDGRVIGGGVEGMLIAANNVQVIVGSFLCGGPKMKDKKEEASEGVRDLERQSVENPTTAPPSQNLTPSSSVGGVRPGSRQMDMRDAHFDIDLMRG